MTSASDHRVLEERAASATWVGVDRLVDATPDLERLRVNRLHLLAARRWRALGREIPDDLLAAERRSVLMSLLVPEVLSRIRAASDGPLVVHKGPEVALRYPDPHLRPYIDLDVLVPDATGVQQSLIAAGFLPVGDPAAYVASPHRQPVELPGLPLHVEVHEAPNWPRWLAPAPTAELLAAAVPSSHGIDGVLTLAPSHHALVVAVHAWAHGPLSRVGDLVDVRAMSEGLDAAELDTLADRWGIGRLWRTTGAAASTVLDGGRRTWALTSWARNLAGIRERTVLEYHVGRWLAPFSAVPTHAALRVMAQEIGRDLRPRPDEEWGQKLGRTGQAVRRARVRKSQHDEELSRRQQR
jgi:hypothetical protein